MESCSYSWHIQSDLKTVKKLNNKLLFNYLLVLPLSAVEITKYKLVLLTWIFFS